MAERKTDRPRKGRRATLTAGRPDGQQELERIAFYSLLSGATILIPLPFVDDWAAGVVRQWMVRDILQRSEKRLSQEQLRRLVNGDSRSKPHGCVFRALFWTVFVPLRVLGFVVARLYRTILFFLLVKAVADRASSAFHYGYLLQRGLEKLDEPIHDESILLLRRAVDEAVLGLDTSPARTVFRRVVRLNRRILAGAAAVLGRLWGRGQAGQSREIEVKMIDREAELLGGIAEKVADLLAGEKGYLKSLDRILDAAARRAGLTA